MCPAFMAPGRYTAPGFFWKHHAYFPSCREASGAGAALVVRAAGRWDAAASCAARRPAAAVDTTMVHKGPGRPNAKIGGCRVGLHMMPLLAVALAVGIFACNSCVRTAKSAKHPCQHFLNCSAADAALARTSDAAHLSLEAGFCITSSVSHDRLLGQRVLLQPRLERDGRPRWHRAQIRAQKSHVGRRVKPRLPQGRDRRSRGRPCRREIGRRRAAGGLGPVAERGRRGRRRPGRRGLRRWPRRGRRRHAYASGVYKTNFTTPPRRRHDVRSTASRTSSVARATQSTRCTRSLQLVRAQATATYAAPPISAPPISRRLCSRESSTKLWMLWRRRL